MKQIYLASRYSRREELCGYRIQLAQNGFLVQARWLDGGHQLSDRGIPIGDGKENAKLRAKFARDDWEDVTNADAVINFTESPRSNASRGGRHVEYGIALGMRKPVYVVGYRENIFHWLPEVLFFETFDEVLRVLAKND